MSRIKIIGFNVESPGGGESQIETVKVASSAFVVFTAGYVVENGRI